jgi:hypothetical protein
MRPETGRVPVGIRLKYANVIAVAFGMMIAAAASSLPASAANPLEKTFYMIGPRFDSVLPACDDAWALATIQRRFGKKEWQFWNSNLQIVNFDQIREVAYRPWADGTIPRRFCLGRAYVSDGQWRTLRFSIIEDGGVIGGIPGVHWCVVGLDRNWANNPDCREAGP